MLLEMGVLTYLKHGRVIAFSGAQNSGKTTLMGELGLALRSKGFNVQIGYNLPSDDKSISRRSKRLGFTINEETQFESQYHILLSYLVTDLETRKHAEINRCDFVIYDRSIWDVAPYSKRVMTDEQYSLIYNMLETHHRLYPTDYLIYCKPVPFFDDGHRSINGDFQREIVNQFEVTLKDKLTFVLDNKPVDKRIDDVLGWLNVK